MSSLSRRLVRRRGYRLLLLLAASCSVATLRDKTAGRDPALAGEAELLRAGLEPAGLLTLGLVVGLILGRKMRWRVTPRTATLNSQLQASHQELLALKQITDNAISTLELDELLRVLLGRLSQVIEADAVMIFLHEDGQLRVGACCGPGPPPELVLPVGMGFVGGIAQRLAPAFLASVGTAPLVDPALVGREVRAALGVPLKRAGRLIGVLHVEWRQHHPESARAARLLEITAERCSMAILNAQLYERACAAEAAARAAEARLRESRERLALALDASNLGVFDWDVRTNTVVWEGQHAQLFGYKPEEFDGTYAAFERRVHPDDLPELRRKIQQARLSRSVYAHEYRLVVPGVQRWIAARGQFVYDGDEAVRMVGVVFDITERKQTEQERDQLYQQVRESRERLQMLSRQLITTQETERGHLARELHDQVGQYLTAIGINIQAALKSASGPQTSQLEDAASLVGQVITQIRTLSLDLRPPMLDDFGLESALRWLLDRQAEKAGWKSLFTARTLGTRAPAEIEAACFRVAQEALTNIARHAQAQRVWVELEQDDEYLRMRVRDDGIGFDLSAARLRASQGGSLGLLGMRERIELLGGRFDIQSHPGRGTEVRVELPLPNGTLSGDDEEGSP